MAQSIAESAFAHWWQRDGDGTVFETEYHFHPERRWRADFAFVDERVLVEIEGGVWTRGRHTRGRGFVRDCEKYNAATLAGWAVLRFPAYYFEDYGKTSEAIKTVVQLLQMRRATPGMSGPE